MATRQVLAEIAADYAACGGPDVAIESVGGVDAAQRVQAGEPFDVVFLAADAIDNLIGSGKAVPGSRVDIVRSEVAMAVKAGNPKPDVSDEQALKRTVLAARSVGYSTGPSGTALLKLFEKWGISAELAPRLVQSKPGIPVGALVARSDVELGFQQLSELIHVEGVDLLGTLPAPVQIVTVFSGAVCQTARDPEAARALLEFMASPRAAEAKHRQGMSPA